MCGRYTLVKGDRIVEIVPNVTMKADLRLLAEGRWNIAPGQQVLAVAEAALPELETMRWGLIPSWAKDPSIANKLINARAETLAQKPAFRAALEKRRCIIPADGFYEWKALTPTSKQPMYIHLKSNRAFAFAGLWETWKNEAGELIKTCTIITTTPNSLLAPIHTRMPAILTSEALREWLDPHPQPAEKLLALLKPYPAADMEMHAVSRAVNSVANEGPALIAPVPESAEPAAPKRPSRKKTDDSSQGSLF